jgi:hypothetical protein
MAKRATKTQAIGPIMAAKSDRVRMAAERMDLILAVMPLLDCKLPNKEVLQDGNSALGPIQRKTAELRNV